MNMIIIAHDIRSMHNVGAIFRNAAAFDVEKIYLTGITATPPRKEISKVALGAQDLVPWETADINDLIPFLKQTGFIVAGLETGEDAIDIREAEGMGAKYALVLGNEVAGIDQMTLSQMDQKFVIPMGKKRSLNVSVASGIAMYVLQCDQKCM